MTLREYLQQHYHPNYISGYENLIKRYTLTMGEQSQTATYKDVLNYIGLLRDTGVHPKTIRNNLFAVKMYYRYLVSVGIRTDHPCQHLYLKDQINRQIELENLYTKERMQSFYDNWKSKNTKEQNRDKIMIGLFIFQGLTSTEITQLKITDLNLEKGTIYIASNVKNKERTLALKPDQILLFYKYITGGYKTYKKLQLKNEKAHNFLLMYGNGTPLYPTYINRLINDHLPPPERLTPLKIRQSIIYNLLKDGHDLRVVQEFAGHRSPTSTEAYKQTGFEELQTAIERLHPLQ
ncbi:MAG: tyrosine-type recombinase/integrase [Flavobacteriia bacterium]|nr:tyrosine-type recombinase/integrase [Flavobacteriia bacterium]